MSFCFFYGEKEEAIAEDIRFACSWEPGILGCVRSRNNVQWAEGVQSNGSCLNFFLSPQVYEECLHENPELMEKNGKNIWVCTRIKEKEDFEAPQKIVMLCEKEEEGILFGRMVVSMLGIRNKEPRDLEEYLLALQNEICWMDGVISTKVWSEIRNDKKARLKQMADRSPRVITVHVDGMEYLTDAMYELLEIREYLPQAEILFGLGDSCYDVKVLLYLAGEKEHMFAKNRQKGNF